MYVCMYVCVLRAEIGVCRGSCGGGTGFPRTLSAKQRRVRATWIKTTLPIATDGMSLIELVKCNVCIYNRIWISISIFFNRTIYHDEKIGLRLLYSYIRTYVRTYIHTVHRFVGRSEQEARDKAAQALGISPEEAGSLVLSQDEDVLDTWFRWYLSRVIVVVVTIVW